MKLDLTKLRKLNLSRTNQLLAIALVVQLVLTFVALLPASTSASGQPAEPLLPGFKTDDVGTITIRDLDGNEIVLTRNPGGDWILPKADNYPASAAQVRGFLDKVKALKMDRLIAENRASHSQLRVADASYARLIDFKHADGKTERLWIGSTVGGSATHMRVNDQDRVYLTSGLAEWDVPTRPAAWITTPYFTVAQESIVGLRVQNAQGVFDLKKVNGAWTLDGLAATEKFNPDSVTKLLGQVASLNLTAPIGTADQERFHMNAPSAVITLTTENNVSVEPTTPPGSQLGAPLKPTPTTPPPINTTVQSTFTLAVGAKLDSGDYILKSSASPYYVQVSYLPVEPFVNLKRADLLVAPATQAATPAR
jgi:Domain of unknown function (DUF4340)